MTSTPARAQTIHLLLSILGLYAFPHLMENWVVVGLSFALIMVLASGPTLDRPALTRYGIYAAISVATYYCLFKGPLWETLFGWLPNRVEPWTGIPVSPSSAIMAYAGWLLLRDPKHRQDYVRLTLAIHLPISMLIHLDPVDSVFELAAKLLGYRSEYISGHQAWQFLWLLTYFLPVYRWSGQPSPLLRRLLGK